MIRLDTICQLAKSLKTAVVKENSIQIVECELKFSDLPIQRDVMDELIGFPVGWSAAALYDEQGAPFRVVSIEVQTRPLRVTGRLCGPDGKPTLPLLQADLSELSFGLVNLGAVVEGKLTWPAKGDEVEDVMELLGKTCKVEWEISDGSETREMFPAQPSVARETMRKILQGPWGAPPAEG